MRSFPSSWNKTLAQLGFSRKQPRSAHKPVHAARPLRIESLEDRRMLSAGTFQRVEISPGDPGGVELDGTFLGSIGQGDEEFNVEVPTEADDKHAELFFSQSGQDSNTFVMVDVGVDPDSGRSNFYADINAKADTGIGDGGFTPIPSGISRIGNKDPNGDKPGITTKVTGDSGNPSSPGGMASAEYSTQLDAAFMYIDETPVTTDDSFSGVLEFVADRNPILEDNTDGGESAQTEDSVRMDIKVEHEHDGGSTTVVDVTLEVFYTDNSDSSFEPTILAELSGTVVGYANLDQFDLDDGQLEIPFSFSIEDGDVITYRTSINDDPIVIQAGVGQKSQTNDINENPPEPISLLATETTIFEANVFGSADPCDCDADFDRDGDVDGADFLLWQEGFGIMFGAVKGDGDADGDGDVDGADLECWEAHYGSKTQVPILGDFNLDGDVDMDDLAIVSDGLVEGIDSGASLGDGDSDGDGDVDALDYLAWQVRYGQATGSTDWLDSALMFDPDSLESGQIIVSNPLDDDDGDYSLGDLSLREALQIASSTTNAAPDVIVFANNATGTLVLTEGELNVDSDVNIGGPGSSELTIDGDGSSRVFNIDSAATVTISDLTITGGSLSGDGGGIFNDGDLSLERVVVEGNNAGGNDGGGLYSAAGSSVHIDQSTFDNNSGSWGGGAIIYTSGGDDSSITNSTFSNNTGSYGGGLHIRGGIDPADVEINNSTFSGNTASASSGGIRVQLAGNVNLINSTVTENTATTGTAGGLSAWSGASFLVHNSIVVGNSAPANPTKDDADGNSISAASSYNLVESVNAGNPLADLADNNQVVTELQVALGPLQDNGGLTQTHALQAGSVAIDAGDDTQSASLMFDQRGANRHFYAPGASSSVDVGAYESGLIVTVANDENDVTFDRTDLSLREALAAAKTNFTAEGVTNWIEFDSSLVGPIAVTLGELVVDSDVNIIGPDTSISIDASAGSSRVFWITSAATVEMSDLTITGGSVTGDVDGGGIYNSGDLTLRSSVVEYNDSEDHAGGIFTTGPLRLESSSVNHNTADRSVGIYAGLTGSEELTILNSTIAHNTGTGGNGGGILLTGGTDNAHIINSTISNNSGNYGGGIRVLNSSTVLEIINSTITQNTATGQGGGIQNSASAGNGATIIMHNTIVSDNTSTGFSSSHDAKGDLSGTVLNPSSFNLLGTVSDSNLTNGDDGNIVGEDDPMLGALADNGGPTLTHAPLANSPVIDAGSDSLALAFGLLTDQRGDTRFDDGDDDEIARVDIGALEIAFADL